MYPLQQYVFLTALLAFASPGWAAQEFHTAGPLTPESEAARKAITVRTVEPEPQPDPWPIESFSYGFARGNFTALAQREQQNPNAFIN